MCRQEFHGEISSPFLDETDVKFWPKPGVFLSTRDKYKLDFVSYFSKFFTGNGNFKEKK